MEKANSRQHNWLRRSCIGKGSFGTVTLAVDKSDGHIFAVKSVEQASRSSGQLEALENEIRILKSLSSPYVVKYLGDDVTAESMTTPYRNLLMEYVPGGTAAELARSSGGDVDEGIIRSLTSCLVFALRYVHASGIVHCDVKGKNVLVGATSGAAAKLADFGSAAEMTADIRPRGSPLWMAPEVVRGEYQGPESDVWSVGCTVIEMVTGKPPWEDRGADTLFRIGYSDELPKFPTQLTELGRDFLGKCLRKDRTQRWSCDQLLQHPFLKSSCPSDMITDWSPRCTLDWTDSNFSDEDDDQPSYNFQTLICNGQDRISKLASNSGVIWEDSDEWVTVRTSSTEQDEVSVSCRGGDGEESERANSELTVEITEEYSDSIGIGETSGRTNLEYLDSSFFSLLPERSSYCTNRITARAEPSVAGSSCPYEFENNKNYSYCNFAFNKSCLYHYYYIYECNYRSYVKNVYFYKLHMVLDLFSYV